LSTDFLVPNFFFLSWQVRAAAVYALGTFINNSSERTDHANSIDHGVAMNLAGVMYDASPIVRRVSSGYRFSACDF
jgi:hypothetical protein